MWKTHPRANFQDGSLSCSFNSIWIFNRRHCCVRLMANLDSLIRFFDLSILASEARGLFEFVYTGWIGYSRLSLVTICKLFHIAITEDEMKCSREYWVHPDLNILVCVFCPLSSSVPACQQRMQIFSMETLVNLCIWSHWCYSGHL